LLESRTGENAPLKLLRNAAQTAGAPTFAERSHSTPVKGGSLRNLGRLSSKHDLVFR